MKTRILIITLLVLSVIPLGLLAYLSYSAPQAAIGERGFNPGEIRDIAGLQLWTAISNFPLTRILGLLLACVAAFLMARAVVRPSLRDAAMAFVLQTIAVVLVALSLGCRDRCYYEIARSPAGAGTVRVASIAGPFGVESRQFLAVLRCPQGSDRCEVVVNHTDMVDPYAEPRPWLARDPQTGKINVHIGAKVYPVDPPAR
ncbi:MAG: hypothetical protein K1X39_04445 [Thermoflexales bacterium]|nr:hypothetical protein [Thermoflexales bacterium]